MKRRLFGTLLWFFLLPALGFTRFLTVVVRALGVLSPRVVVAAIALLVVMGSPNPLAAQFSVDAFKPIGFLALPWGLPVLVILVLVLGARSRFARRFRRKLARSGRFLGVVDS